MLCLHKLITLSALLCSVMIGSMYGECKATHWSKILHMCVHLDCLLASALSVATCSQPTQREVKIYYTLPALLIEMWYIGIHTGVGVGETGWSGGGGHKLDRGYDFTFGGEVGRNGGWFVSVCVVGICSHMWVVKSELRQGFQYVQKGKNTTQNNTVSLRHTVKTNSPPPTWREIKTCGISGGSTVAFKFNIRYHTDVSENENRPVSGAFVNCICLTARSSDSELCLPNRQQTQQTLRHALVELFLNVHAPDNIPMMRETANFIFMTLKIGFCDDSHVAGLCRQFM